MNIAKSTPGPWYWHIDSQGAPSLRTPDRGQLIVMDFGRLGMQRGTARFAEWPGISSGVQRQRLGGILCDAKHWFSPESGINHPDARLIAASPDLMDAARAAMICIGELSPTQARVETMQALQAAVEKAGGGE